MRTPPAWTPALLAGLLVALSSAGASCTDIKPGGVMHRSNVTSPEVSHADFDDLLARLVDAQGRVDYRELVRDTGTLDRYYHWLNTTSPDSDPELFPTTEAELAYWINAYNASVLITVVEYYPIDSVVDVPAPFPIWIVSDKAGFFLLQRIDLGGETMSLYGLENSVIRDRYDEPRIHFALNCASKGCPRLPREAFTGEKLDAQLDREAQRFFAEERNLSIDHQARVVRLSSILDWYEDNFTGWYEKTHPGSNATLLDYVALYAPVSRADDLRIAAQQDYEIEFVPYDWGLNAQSTP